MPAMMETALMKLIGFIVTAVLSLTLGVAAPLFAQQEKHGDKQDHPQQQAKHEQSKPAQQHAQPQHQEKQQPAQHAERQPRQENKQPQHAQQQSKHEQSKPSAQHAQQQRQPSQKHQPTQHAQQQQRTDQHTQQAHGQPQQKSDRARQSSQQAQQRGHEPGRRTPEQQRMQHTAWHQHGSQHWESDHRTWQQRGGYRGYRIPDDRFRGYFGRDHGFRISGLPFLVVGGFPRFQYQGYWFSAVDPWPEYWGDDWYDNDDVYVAYVDNGYYLYNRRYPNVGIAIDISM
jgi:outer membrane biosynthesis protein TonB